MNDNKFALTPLGNDTEFYKHVAELLAEARQFAKKQLDNTIVTTYYEVGRMIVEREQQGQKRAQYGAKLINELSEYLAKHYGQGFSVANLKNIRKFYQVYSSSIQQTLSANSQKRQSLISVFDTDEQKQQTPSAKSRIGKTIKKGQTLSAQFKKGQTASTQSKKGQTVSAQSKKGQTASAQFKKEQTASAQFEKGQTVSAQCSLSWSHYQILMRVENEAARRFYEIETVSQQWSVRQLRRQVSSSLYERLGFSRNKKKIMALANEGQIIESSRDIFKTPYILEFTGLEERSEYSETELEEALINNLQKFLIELGKGFLFEARQKRFSFDEKSFYVDLVFYNRLLQCYVLIDLKVAELKHQDLGQMLMYVNYFDRYVRQEFERPTIGILLCSQKDDNIVELTLPEDSNIYASTYSLYLPDKALLQRKLAEWVEEFEENHKEDNE
jgi:predicted nuclease of restriction endonuclease-like (RecB) superfamily